MCTGHSRPGLNRALHSFLQTKGKVEGRFLLDVELRQSTSVLQLLASEHEPLLVWGDAFLVLSPGLYILDSVGGFRPEGGSLAAQGSDKELHSRASLH